MPKRGIGFTSHPNFILGILHRWYLTTFISIVCGKVLHFIFCFWYSMFFSFFFHDFGLLSSDTSLTTGNISRQGHAKCSENYSQFRALPGFTSGRFNRPQTKKCMWAGLQQWVWAAEKVMDDLAYSSQPFQVTSIHCFYLHRCCLTCRLFPSVLLQISSMQWDVDQVQFLLQWSPQEDKME